MVVGSFLSRYRRGATTRWRLALPPGTDPNNPRRPDGGRLPVCLVLHGRGGDCSVLTQAGYEPAFAALLRTRVRPFALVAIDGTDRYWHRRQAGDDISAAISQELFPLLAKRGLATRPADKIAITGLSMGGYGALLLAETWTAARVAACGAMSPALWVRAGQSAPGAFDSAADFTKHDVFARRNQLKRIPVRVDCGRSDPFFAATVAFAKGLGSTASVNLDKGGHSEAYWRGHAPAQLGFLANRLPAPS